MQTESKSIKPEQIVEIIFVRRWFLIVPFCLTMFAGIYLSFTLPKKYQATTLILVEAQRVPQGYVQALVSSDIHARISTISQQIMSRTNIEKIINEFKLYTGEKYKNMFSEDKIKEMRNRITVNVTGSRTGAEAFSVSFQGVDPEKVANVSNTLARYFIDENLKVREVQAMGTSNFLEDELKTMRDRLESVENTLKDYRVKHTGELPEQLESNLRILDRLQEQMSQGTESLRSTKRRLYVLQSQIAQNERNQTLTTGAQAQAGEPDQLETLRHQLGDLETRYTALHPDVVRLKSMIAKLEAQPDQKKDDTPAVAVPAEIPANIPRQGQNETLQAIGLKSEIQRLETQLKGISKQAKIYQKHVEAVPHREQELMSLRRDYQNIQASYSSLLNRKLEAEIAVNMEKKQKGEQFRIVDQAKVPGKPISPNMKKIFMFMVAAGLGIGGGMIFLLEYFNSSFRSVEEIEEHLGLSVFTTIPEKVSSKRKLFRKLNLVMSFFGVFVACGLFLVLAALAFMGENQIREIIGRLGVV